ncbi:MAG: GIY-YIG nuclease family protein [Candidatus Heimdallarchaeota archaeon]|nr:MAG: GIY-YIG nuclease family protein [Candidatus Heimdallarchaeota archaeon]
MVTCSDGTIYTGYTKDLLKRLEQHNSGSKGARYTKTRRPVKLSFVEIVQTQKDAILRELELKRLPRERKLDLINGVAE